MRKRSASESGRGNSPQNSHPHPVPGKLRKIRHSSGRGEESSHGTGSRRKLNNLDSTNSSRKRNHSAVGGDGTLDNRNYQSQDNNAVRKHVMVSGSSDDGPVTRESKKAYLSSSIEAKWKQDPLPDIMHDWEIIVNSLRETETNGEAAEPEAKKEAFKELPKIVNSKPNVRPSRHELTDSDKENSSLKKKSEEFATPISPIGSKLKLSRSVSQVEEKSPKKGHHSPSKLSVSPSKIANSESSEESVGLWRRPTRSTYKAFEDVFDPVLLGEQSKEKVITVLSSEDQKHTAVESSVNNDDSPLKVAKINTPPSIGKSPNMMSRKNKSVKKLDKIVTPVRRRITRQMEKEGITTNDIFSSPSSEDEDSQFKNKQNSTDGKVQKGCSVSLAKINFDETLDMDEPDFLGFGSPPQKQVERLSSRISKRKMDSSPVSTTPIRKKGKIGRPRKRPESQKMNKDSHSSPVRQIIEECRLEETEDSEEAIEVVRVHKNSVVGEFESIFGPDESSLPCNFEGFTCLHPKGRYCSQCSLLLGNMDELKEHKKIGHKRIYSCLFDSGSCGQLKGSVAYGSHIANKHRQIVSHLSSVVLSDIKFGKIANWIPGEDACSVCLVPLFQPGKCLHEMLLHGIWPPSLLSLMPVAIDQYISLWWTGKNVAFACHLCHSTQSNRKNNVPIVTSSAHAFPNLVANHLRNVHLVNVPLMQGWWLLIRLLISLPYGPRKTLSSLITLTVNNEQTCACLLCGLPFAKIDSNSPSTLCTKCEKEVNKGSSCWFQCKGSQQMRSISDSLKHMLENHKPQLPGGWCIQCGVWDDNLLFHMSTCPEMDDACRFCEVPIKLLSPLIKSAHSFKHHTFPCPIPNCPSPFHSESNVQSHSRFPTTASLFKHLVGQHLPEWGNLSLDDISKLISVSKGNQGYVLTNISAQNFIGSWIGLSGHLYTLVSEVLSPMESIKVSRICFLCHRQWQSSLMHDQKNLGSVCEECLGTLLQWDNGDPSSQCPVFSCLKNISSFSFLLQHLIAEHKLSEFQNRKKFGCCSYHQNTPISIISHNLAFHCQPCLACKFTAPTAAQIKSHRSMVHGFFTWNSLFHHLKNEELKKEREKKTTSQYGVMRVWQGDIKVQAQLDPTVDISALICEDSEKDSPVIIGHSPQDSAHFLQGKQTDEDLNEVDPWCSSLCAVSMSPCKVSESNPVSVDRDIQAEVSDVLRKLSMSGVDDKNGLYTDYNSASPDLLIPSISVGEPSEQLKRDSVNCNFVSKSQWKINANNIGSPRSDTSSEVPLEIDSSAPSPEPHSISQSTVKSDRSSDSPKNELNRLTVTIPASIPSNNPDKITKSFSNDSLKNESNKTENASDPAGTSAAKSNGLDNAKAPQLLEFMDSVNMMVAETLQSMSKVFSKPPSEKRKKAPTTASKGASNLKKERGLGENASFDEGSMAENILKDLEEKFSSTCIDCGIGIHLPELAYHFKAYHSGKIIHCLCGFKGELNAFLVHSFHMSHIPCEARPILIGDKEAFGVAMIVLEARPEVKTLSFPCFKCGKRFKQEKSRQLHYNLCKLEKKFNCDICGEKFALENHLSKHKEWKHNPQTCTYCKKVFNSSSSLAQHVQHIHKKQLGHHCKQCKDSFNTLSQLKVHIRTHTGEEPHACHMCSLGFISRNLLRKHLASDHKEESSSDDEGSEMDSSPLKPKSRLNHSKTKSSLGSSSDESTPGRKKVFKKSSKLKDTEMQINLKSLPLTESDLETSVSESEKVTIHKKTKQQNKAINAAATQEIISKSPMVNKGAAPEALVLPELRSEVRDKVRSQVGKVCNPCGQEFESPIGKLLHMYLIHPGFILSLGFNQCCFCEFKFSSADDVSDHHLTKHQRTFMTNGNFRCLCGLTFREDGAYYFHLYYAHKAQRALNVGGEIVCRLCEGRPRLNKIVDLVVHLSDRHTMFDHVRFNDSYMCNFCYKAFESWTVLSLHFFMVHKATKSQTLSYDCPYCQGASPWHSLEALQYHLDNVHRGRHNKSQPIPEHTRGIYMPALPPSSPTKKKEPPRPNPPKRQRKPKQSILKSMEADPDVLYCTCQCPYDEVSDMIGCDNPNCKYQWFHFECVGIMAAPEGNWYCPDCTSFAQQKEKEERKKRQIQADLYEYYSNLKTDDKVTVSATPATPATRSGKSNSSNSSSSGSSSSSSSNSSSSSSSSSDSSSESEAN